MKLALKNDSPCAGVATVTINGDETWDVTSLEIRVHASPEFQRLLISRFDGAEIVTDWLDITSLSIELETREG